MSDTVELIRAYVEGYRGSRDAPAFEACVEYEINERLASKDKRIAKLEAMIAAKDEVLINLINVLEPFALIGREIRKAATGNQWLETPLFYAGTIDDPQCMTLTGKAFNNAAAAIEAARSACVEVE